MTRSRPGRPAPRGVAGLLASRGARISVAAMAAIIVAASGLTAAIAATGTSASNTVPPTVVASPDQASQPGALPIAEPPAGWMDHDLLVRVQQWSGGQAGCSLSATALADARAAQAVSGGCGATPQLTTAAPPGYSPALLRAYLHLSGTGAGESVAVVDAYDNPYATSDITTFSQQFGLPLPCTTGKKKGCFSFSVTDPYGFAQVDPGWALESDLDIEMVHAIAPDAAITLVEGYDATYTSLVQAIDYAATAKPAPVVISNSYGAAEFTGESTGDQHCALTGTLCVFSTGDAGNPGEYPATNPYVLSVGGTTLDLTASGAVGAEGAWCCTNGAGGGGGVSQYESRPAYQDSVNSYQGRGTPDVSFDADPYSGVPVYDTFGVDGQNGWFEIGGTSVGAPAWSGIIAAADQLRAQAHKAPLQGAGFQAQDLIYGMSHATVFGDITTGVDNAIECTSPVQVCQAQPGWDFVTGWGSPRPGIDTALASA